MAKVKVIFHKLIQDSQDYGSDDEHMVSRVFFSIDVEGNVTEDVYVDIKQPVGSDFETTPLEVYRPVGYSGPWNYEAFRKAAEGYYRSLVGSKSSGINIAGRARMRNNLFVKRVQADFEVQQ